MCGGGSKPTDPAKVAQSQYNANLAALQDAYTYNAVDQYGPFGSTTYARRADGTPYAQSVTYSPQLQGYMNDTFNTAAASNDYTRNQYGAGNAYLDAVYPAALATDLTSQGVLNQRFGAASDVMGRLPGQNVTAQDTSKIAQTSFDQSMAKLQPQIDEQRQQASLMLQNRGIPVGSEVYNAEMSRLERGINDSMASVARQAQLDAGMEQTRQIAADSAVQMLPYQELQAIQAGQYSAANPNAPASAPAYTAPAAMQTPGFQEGANNVAGAYANYDQQMAAQNQSMLGGLFGIGKAIMAPSMSLFGNKLW